MTDARKIIKKIRRIPELNIRDTSKDWLIDIRAKKIAESEWEKAKDIKRQHNFEAMQRANQERKEAQEAEALRQEEINLTRLKNLRKARRALKKRSTT